MKKVLYGLFLFILTYSLFIINPINVGAHDDLLNVGYDKCEPDEHGDGEDEI